MNKKVLCFASAIFLFALFASFANAYYYETSSTYEKYSYETRNTKTYSSGGAFQITPKPAFAPYHYARYGQNPLTSCDRDYYGYDCNGYPASSFRNRAPYHPYYYQNENEYGYPYYYEPQYDYNSGVYNWGY